MLPQFRAPPKTKYSCFSPKRILGLLTRPNVLLSGYPLQPFQPRSCRSHFNENASPLLHCCSQRCAQLFLGLSSEKTVPQRVLSDGFVVPLLETILNLSQRWFAWKVPKGQCSHAWREISPYLDGVFKITIMGAGWKIPSGSSGLIGTLKQRVSIAGEFNIQFKYISIC